MITRIKFNFRDGRLEFGLPANADTRIGEGVDPNRDFIWRTREGRVFGLAGYCEETNTIVAVPAAFSWTPAVPITVTPKEC